MKLFELLEQYEEINEDTGIGAIFLSPTAVVVGQAHGQPLQLSPQTLQKVQQIANQYGAWSEGNRGDERFTQGQINSYKGSWDDLFAQSVSDVPYPFLYTMMSNVKENNTLQKIGAEPRLSIFSHLLSKQQAYSFFPNKKFSAETLQKFFEAISQGKYNFVQMAKQPATSLNIQNFISIGEKLMWPANWQSYPNNAGKVAKQATDARDKWLAQQTKGAFIVGSGHLLQVSKLTNKPIVEKWSNKYKKSINCSNPKGFSQKAHCAGRKKNEAINGIGHNTQLSMPKNTVVIDTPGELDWFKIGQHFPTLGQADPKEFGQSESDMVITFQSEKEKQMFLMLAKKLGLTTKDIGGTAQHPEIHKENFANGKKK